MSNLTFTFFKSFNMNFEVEISRLKIKNEFENFRIQNDKFNLKLNTVKRSFRRSHFLLIRRYWVKIITK